MGSVVAAVMVMNSVFPAIVRSGNSLARMADHVEDRIASQIKVVYATGELDENATWQDVDSDTYFDVTFWAKNVGAVRIIGIAETDIFFGVEGDFARIPYTMDAGGAYPQWAYTIENGTEWTNAVTVRFSIHYDVTKTSDEYFVKIIAPTGAYDDHYFSF
ncbi:MAG: hypothetical protein IIC95_08870 [Chloroflexi bacterium]|nr:hypothetical protein [Chloroflexota bacterium]MCH7656073.1 hypothetical protein [Chloroflexota bacterium]